MEYKERQEYMARLEASMYENSKQFFDTRPDLDIPFNVKMFDQGFERGFNVASKESGAASSTISMGENVGWISGPHDAVKAVQKLIIDGEGYRKYIRELESQSEIDTKRFLDEFNVVADLGRKISSLESKLEYAIETMRIAQGLLKDGGQGSIVDTVWIDDKSNTTLWERLEMTIDNDETPNND